MSRTIKTIMAPVWGTSAGARLQGTSDAAIIGAHALESFRRTRWLYRGSGAIPRIPITYRSPTPGDATELCARLIDAYHRALAGAPEASGMWSHAIFQGRHRGLLEPLRDRNPASLAEQLDSMFRSDFVIGMAAGSLGVAHSTRWSRRLAMLQMLDRLVSVAEYLGATHTENPEQGAVAVAFASGPEALVEAIERKLGASLDFPDAGAAYGLEIAGRMITPDSPDQIYGAARLRDAIGTHLGGRDGVSVVEIGGGYGGMAYWLLRLLDLRYTIVDLPEINVLQGYFLASALGHDEVGFHGEDARRVMVRPTHALEDIPVPFSVLANKDSIPEIPATAVDTYLRWAQQNCDGLLYSYNQEAAAVFEGVAQNVVHEALEPIGGFTRVSRERSWVRDGYVEEIFIPDRRPSAS